MPTCFFLSTPRKGVPSAHYHTLGSGCIWGVLPTHPKTDPPPGQKCPLSSQTRTIGFILCPLHKCPHEKKFMKGATPHSRSLCHQNVIWCSRMRRWKCRHGDGLCRLGRLRQVLPQHTGYITPSMCVWNGLSHQHGMFLEVLAAGETKSETIP